MNNSGLFIEKLIKKFKLQNSNLVVAHDDLDIPLGKFKIQKGVGPKLHNGIKSIENELDTKDFWRIRIGVDNRTSENQINGEAYVLQNFSEKEQKSLAEIFHKVYSRIQLIK